MAHGEYSKTLTIASLERLLNTRMGNPRYRVVFTNGLVAETERDSQVGYLIVDSGFQGVPVLVHFNKEGHISEVKAVSSHRGEH